MAEFDVFKNGTYHLWCKQCSAKKFGVNFKEFTPQQKSDWNKGRRQRKSLLFLHVYDYLLQHPCVDCGEQDFMVLEFDHVRGVKEYNISTILSDVMSLETLKVELAKCDVRCSNCHNRITHVRSNSWRWMITQPEWADEFWRSDDIEEDDDGNV